MSSRAVVGSLRRGWWAIVAVAAAAAAAAYLVTSAGPDRAVAEATLVAVPASEEATAPAELADTLAPLVESRSMIENVIGNLRLETTPAALRERVATRTDEGRIVIAVEDEDVQRAIRIAQELALVFVQLVQERFASAGDAAPAVTVFDAAHPVEPDARDPLLVSAVAAAGAALAALLAALLFLRPATGPGAPAAAPLPAEARADGGALDARAEELVNRERALVGRHAEIAARTRDLAERERALEERVAAVTRRELELVKRAAHGPEPTPAPAPEEPEPELEPVPVPAAEPERPAAEPVVPQPEPEPQPQPEPAAAPAPAADGGFNLERLQRLVETAAPGYNDARVEEWRYYLVFLRDHARYDGRLPANFDSLVADVFGELLD